MILRVRARRSGDRLGGLIAAHLLYSPFVDDNDGWLGNFLLGHEGRQVRDIERLKSAAASAGARSEAAVTRAAALQNRVDRLELVCEALLHVILQRGLADRDELARIMTRIDLRDGVEDGRVRGDTPAYGAPLCSLCELPVNPKRTACVYCGAAIAPPPQAAPPAPRMVTCTRCGKQVQERRTVFTGKGPSCDDCHTAG